jgi:hypothetical protein
LSTSGTDLAIIDTDGETASVPGCATGAAWVVTWTENGIAYWLSSERREITDLLRLAGSLR